MKTRDRYLGIDLRLPNLLFVAVAGTAAAIALVAADIQPLAIWILVGLAILILGVVTFRSRTVFSWAGRRLTYRRRRRPTLDLADGVRWDGHRGLAYIEILPEAYETTIIGADHETTVRAIPVDVIREELVQFDIHCDSVTIFTAGWKYHRPTELAVIYHAEIGPTPVLLNGRTYVEVAVALDGSLDSVYARTGKEGIPTGLVRAVSIAAERIRRRLIAEGFHAHLLSSAEATELTNRLDSQFRGALDDEHWDSAGPNTMRTIAFSPTKAAWTADNYREWCRINPHRHLHIVRLDRRRGIDHAEMYLAFQTNDASALSTVGALGLRREYGQQGDILSTAMPSVRTTAPTAIPAKMLADAPFPLPLQAGGVGTFLGYTRTRALLFVNFGAGSTPFYVISPAALCQQLLLRLATTGLSIDIDIPGKDWGTFAARIGATHGSNPGADILVSADHAPLQQAFPTQTRLVWTTTAPQTRPNFAIVAGADECALYTPSGVTHYVWSTSTSTESYLTAPTPHRRRPTRQPVPPPPPVTRSPAPLRASRPNQTERRPLREGPPQRIPPPPVPRSPNGAPRQPIPPPPRSQPPAHATATPPRQWKDPNQ